MSDAASVVADRALDLAHAGREDDRAVAELVRLASGRTRVLENAERFSRQGAKHREDRIFNRAHRLLVAASRGRRVEPLSDDDEQLLEAVEAFHQLGREQAWAVLVAGEPRLGDLEQQVKNAAFATPQLPLKLLDDALWRPIAREKVLEGSELGDRLRELVGPLANTTDHLLRSRAAFATALTHLANQNEG